MATESTAGAQSAKKSSAAAPAAAEKTTAAASSTTAPAAATAPARPAASPVNPAGAAVADAAREAEIRQLTAERDALREKVGKAPQLETLRAEVDALRQVAARAGVTGTARWTMSAGVAADLETRGYATDPDTGAALVRDGDQVTITERSGTVRTIAMPKPSGAGESPAPAGRKN
jgi:hypothetical protein